MSVILVCMHNCTSYQKYTWPLHFKSLVWTSCIMRSMCTCVNDSQSICKCCPCENYHLKWFQTGLTQTFSSKPLLIVSHALSGREVLKVIWQNGVKYTDSEGLPRRSDRQLAILCRLMDLRLTLIVCFQISFEFVWNEGKYGTGCVPPYVLKTGKP